MENTLRLGGIVLCGGHSRRMGQAKEWLSVEGRPMLGQVVRIVGEVADPVVVAARAGQNLPALPAGTLVVCDESPDQGPLAGVVAGLTVLAGRCDAAFVTGCDHPWLRPAFIRALADRLGTFDAVVVHEAGRDLPLPAVYRVGLAAAGRELLATGRLRVDGLLSVCRGTRIAPESLPPESAARAALTNVNRPDDLRHSPDDHPDASTPRART